MAVLHLRASQGKIVDPKWPCRDIEPKLRTAMANSDPDAPLAIYVHGHTNWPHPDILAQAEASNGLAIQFLWDGLCSNATAPLKVNALYLAAGERAAELRQLLCLIGRADPSRPVDLMCHSLGARICLVALRDLPRVSLSRVICLAGVEFGAQALMSVHAVRNKNIDFFNITTQEQSFFHSSMQVLGPKPGPKDRLLSMGFAFPQANWLEIQLGRPSVRTPIARLGALSGDLNLRIGSKQAAQLGEALIYRKGEISSDIIRNALGSELPRPLSMVPLRKTSPRVLRKADAL